MTVEIVAVVTAYRSDAIRQVDGRGKGVSFDATDLKIVSPDEYAGSVAMYHAKPCAEDSLWRATSKRVAFHIDPAMLIRSGVRIVRIPSAAASRLQLVDPKGHEAKDHVPRAERRVEAMNVEIIAVVKEYRRAAKWSHYADGTFSVFDATVVEITSPKECAARQVIYHATPCPKDSPWRAVSKSVRFRIDPQLLKRPNVEIGAGAVSELELVEPQKPEKEKATQAEVDKGAASAEATARTENRTRRSPPKIPAVVRREGPPTVERERRTGPPEADE